MVKRVVISGYYGFGNTGDEAVLAGMLAAFRRVGIDARVTVLSADPSLTMRDHPGVESIHRYAILPVARAVAGADLVISGGGSLLQDVTSAISPRYYLAVLQLAHFLGRRTMVYAQGVGPLVRESTRKAVARALNRVGLITVRDPDSRVLLQSIGVDRPPIQVSADPSFLMEPDLRSADALLSGHGLLGEELMAVALRSWPGDWLREAGEAIRRAAERLGVKVVLVPMQRPDDVETCAAVGEAVMLHDLGGPRVVKGVIARCGLVVGMRLHSLIFAAAERVPFVPIVYDPKVASFAAIAEQHGGVGVSSLDARALEDAIVDAWERRAELRERLRERSAQLSELALESARLARELLDE